MVHAIPDGPNPNDSITVGFGAWRAVGGNALDGNDTLFASSDVITVDAGPGNDLIGIFNDVQARVLLGSGDDTIRIGESSATLVGGLGSDSVYLHDGAYSVHTGSGNDTIRLFADRATVDAGHGHDSILSLDSRTFLAAAGGHDTVQFVGGDDVLHVGGSFNKIVMSSGAFEL